MAGCGDVLSLEDLQTAKKHQIFEAEVITGKVGGLAAGAGIDYASNQVTGQVQATLPKILRDIGFKPGMGDFATGFTVQPGQRDYAWYDPVSLNWYSYLGVIPPTGYVVSSGTNPVGNADWKPVTDIMLREVLASNDGSSLVGWCPDIATLRTIEPTADGQHITLDRHTASIPHGGGQFTALMDGTTYTDDKGVIIKTVGGAVWLRLDADVLSPLMFGCAGDANWSGVITGVTDDTLAMRAAISAAASLGRPLRGGGEVYGITSTLPMFAGNAEISHLNIDVIRTTELAELFSFKTADSSRITLEFHHNYILTHSKVRQPLILDGTRRCKVHDNTILAVDTPECYGVRIGISGSGFDNLYNDIYNNYITVGADPDGGSGPVTRNGIALFGDYEEPTVGQPGGPNWGGITSTVQNTRIFNNTISGGTHNIHVRGCNVLSIFGNNLYDGSHRNINLSRMCQRTHIYDNMLINAGSSAVVFGYCRWIKITSNLIYSAVVGAQVGDDAAIQFGEWVDGLDITDNTILGDWVYGIHGEALRMGKISGNDITASFACVALESQWVLTVPPLAKYTKARNVPYKANTNTFDVMISDNKLNIGSGGCAVYLSAFNNRQMQRITVKGNQHSGGSVTDSVYLYEDTAGMFGNCQLLQHAAPGASVNSYFSNSQSAFTMVGDVSGLTTSEVIISAGGDFSHFGATMLSMGGAHAVTNILGYGDGAVVTVRGFAGASLVNNSARIRLRGSVNANFTSGNEIISLMRKSGIWFETARNF